ncbi:MAG: DUF6458 family protein [Solirubrobacteraceae bacterium]
MTIGTSLFLFAVGAVLKFAIEDSVDAINLGTIGVILMIIGAVGLILGLFLMDRGRRDGAVVDREVVRERDPRL